MPGLKVENGYIPERIILKKASPGVIDVGERP